MRGATPPVGVQPARSQVTPPTTKDTQGSRRKDLRVGFLREPWVSFVVDGFLKTRESRSQHPSDNRLACGAGRAFQFLQQLGFQMVRIGMHFTSFDFIIGRAVEA